MSETPSSAEEHDLDDEAAPANENAAVAELDDPDLPNDDPELPEDEPAVVETHGQLHDEED